VNGKEAHPENPYVHYEYLVAKKEQDETLIKRNHLLKA